MGFQADLCTGIAVLLSTAGVGTWNPTAAYAATDTAICIRIMPASPDNIIMLTPYPVSDDYTLSDSVIGLQVRTRTGGEDPTTTDDLTDAVFDNLQGLYGITLSTGIRVQAVERRSSLPLGQDDLHRWVNSDNYYLTCWRPSPHRQ